jgi:hypothetical protein
VKRGEQCAGAAAFEVDSAVAWKILQTKPNNRMC